MKLFAYFVIAALPYLYTPTGGASSSARLFDALNFFIFVPFFGRAPHAFALSVFLFRSAEDSFYPRHDAPGTRRSAHVSDSSSADKHNLC